MADRSLSLRASWDALDRFSLSRLTVVLIGAAAFVSGLTEAGVLVLVTLTATSLLRVQSNIEAFGLSLTRDQAVLLAALLLAGRTAASYVASRLIAQLGETAMKAARLRLITSFLTATWAERSNRRLGDLHEVAGNHVEQVAQLVFTLSTAISAALNLVAFVTIAIVVSPSTALGMLVIGVFLGFVLRPLSRRNRRLARAYVGSAHAFASSVTDTVLVSRDVQTYGVTTPVLTQLDAEISAVASHYGRSRFFMSLTPQLFQTIVLSFAVAGLAVLTQVTNQRSIGAVGAVLLLLLRVATAGQQLVSTTQALTAQAPYLSSVTSTIDRLESGRRELGHRTDLPATPIECVHVGFGYGDTPVLDDISIRIEPGEALAVVGPSGAGKSTLVQLLLRLRQPTSGHIAVGGNDIRDVLESDWASRVAFVPQEPYLFHGTIVENVEFHRDIGEAEVEAALRAAHVLDECRDLPDGIHTLLGPGINVSGGQRQRIAIARALVGNPELLILDEPTAALDPISEQAVRATLEDLKGRMAMVIVAHRFSTISFCDRVLVLSNGRQEALGSPAILSRQVGYYADAIDANRDRGSGEVRNH